MRMVNANDIPGTVLEFAFDTEHIQRIHVISVACAFLIQVFTSAERMNVMVVVLICRPDHQTATLVRIGRFGVIINLT